MARRGKVRYLAAVAALAALAVVAAGCSTTDELTVTGGGRKSTTTLAGPGSEDPSLDDGQLETGSAGLSALQDLLAQLKASDDPCAILTQRDVKGNRLDPTVFTTTASRQVLTQGLIEVYDHLISIADPSIRAPLAQQKDVLVQVLDVVERYTSDPGSTKATDEISTLVNSAAFVQSQQQVTDWISSNCR